MKRLNQTILVLFMAVLMGTLPTFRVFAAETQSPDYIGEVKVYIGDYSAAAAEGFTLLKDGNNPVDLNQNAGGGLGSKGEKAVYLGYKTTKNRSEAITDLALMNMKGGYDVAEYEALFDTYIKLQVIPLTQKYISMLKEYRANFNSEDEFNRAKARYVYDILNLFEDDDTGKTLGDLFLNETKEELEDSYFALSKEEKRNHADLTTIISQANGNATLLMQSLLARASDTNEETFIDRFASLSFDDLIDATGLAPTDAEEELKKLYDDYAQTILETWNDLKNTLDGYDNAVKTVDNYDEEACNQAVEAFKNLNKDSGEATTEKIINDYNEALKKIADVISAGQTIAIHDKLAAIEYEDGTFLDFFTQDYSDIYDDITVLYPFVAALSDGQKAGLEFISLKEMLLMSLTDSEGYKNAHFDSLARQSIYKGVDRAIYEMGGVALTTDARRTGAMENAVANSEYEFSLWSYIGAGVAVITTVCVVGSGAVYSAAKETVRIAQRNYDNAFETLEGIYDSGMGAQNLSATQIKALMDPHYSRDLVSAQRTANVWKGLTVGFSVAFVIISAATVYLTWQDMQEFYEVDFTPIPHYMVDEKDIIGYNKKGEKILLKNQSAYYKAVECNRTASDEVFGIFGTCADMNGDVGKQWLALYSVKNELMEPIIASSLKVIVGSTQIPAGYETGIHMFGSDAAFNLNSSLYDWNNDAPSVYVYYDTDDSADSAVDATGANFTAGTLALSGGVGIALGAVFTGLAMKAKRKPTKKETAAE